LFIIFGLLCISTISAQPWEIGSPVAANVTATLSGGTLTISGTGAIQNFNYPTLQPWYSQRYSITSVIIGNNVNKIGDFAFYDCLKITSITIPASVESIGDYVFWGGLGIQTVDILGNNLKTIGNSAFFECESLTSIFIPESVEIIGDFAFSRCTALTSIVVDANNSNYISENGILFNTNKTRLVAFLPVKEGNYTIPETVEIISNGAFEASKLISVVIPASVEIIGSNAFNGSNIHSVTILGNMLKTIDEAAFYSCNNLISITIPASIETIGQQAFFLCKKLVEIVNLNEIPIKIPNSVFDIVTLSNCTLRVPAVSIKYYKEVETWKRFENIEPIEDELTKMTLNLDKNEIYLLNGATTAFSAIVTGDLPEDEFVLWNNSTPEVATTEYSCATGTTVPNSETGLGNQVFHECYGSVIAISPGMAKITVTAFEKQATCTVTVIQPGNSSFVENVNSAGGNNVRVNLYMKPPESDTKRGISFVWNMTEQ